MKGTVSEGRQWNLTGWRYCCEYLRKNADSAKASHFCGSFVMENLFSGVLCLSEQANHTPGNKKFLSQGFSTTSFVVAAKVENQNSLRKTKNTDNDDSLQERDVVGMIQACGVGCVFLTKLDAPRR
jgi:hypothetical protein